MSSYYDNGGYGEQGYNEEGYQQDWTSDNNDYTGDAAEGQEGYYENYGTQEGGDEEVKSAGTPTYDEPENFEGNGERGEKREAEAANEEESDAKKPKDEDPERNSVSELNQKIPGIEFRLVNTGGVIHAPMFTMQVTIAGQVFEAESNTKKKARQMAAQSALDYLTENNIAPDNPVLRKTPKNPTVILNEVRPHSKYEFVEDEEVDGKKVYTMKLKLEDEEYIGKAKSKGIAKALAACQALTKLCGLEFNIPEDGTMPIYEGDNELWMKFKKPKLNILFEDQNPINMIHSMYRPLQFEVEQINEEPPEWKCYINIEEQTFTGVGPSRQVAKGHASFDALTMLKDRGMLEQKKAEAAAAREARLAEIRAQKEAELAERLQKEKEEKEKKAAEAAEKAAATATS